MDDGYSEEDNRERSRADAFSIPGHYWGLNPAELDFIVKEALEKYSKVADDDFPTPEDLVKFGIMCALGGLAFFEDKVNSGLVDYIRPISDDE